MDPLRRLNVSELRPHASQAAGSSGAMLWSLQPRGHAVDGDGYGFTYKDGDALREFKELFGSWSNLVPDCL